MESLKQMRIFLVDDDLFTLSIYEKHLRNLGFADIQLYKDGHQCLNHLHQEPQIIFLDHHMDGLCGIETLKNIKRYDPNIYVIFISGQEDIQTAVNALKYGAFEYIIKHDGDLAKIEDVLNKIEALQEMLRRGNGWLRSKIQSFF
jgi:DNA-binding NtrC family response regulator